MQNTITIPHYFGGTTAKMNQVAPLVVKNVSASDLSLSRSEINLQEKNQLHEYMELLVN